MLFFSSIAGECLNVTSKEIINLQTCDHVHVEASLKCLLTQCNILNLDVCWYDCFSVNSMLSMLLRIDIVCVAVILDAFCHWLLVTAISGRCECHNVVKVIYKILDFNFLGFFEGNRVIV